MLVRGALTASFASALFYASLAPAQTLTFARDDYASYAGARAIATADFDRNGWPDLAQANTGRNTVTILLNHRDTGLTRAFDVAVGSGPFDLTTGDYNRDGVPDLAVANADGHSISILLGKGDGSFTRRDLAAPAQNPRAITTADVNKDAKPDLIYSGYATRTVQVLIGDGAGGFTTGATYVGSPANPQGIRAADFNHDGYVDIALAYASAGGLRILYSDRGTGFTGRTIAGDTDLNVVTVGDFNNDGWEDVVAASTSNSTVGIYLGGATGLAHTTTYATGASPRGIVAADVNGDGALDIVTANRGSSTVSVLLGDRANPGRFLSRMEVGAGSGSRGVVANDFNADGRLDLATGNEYANAVTVLSNETLLQRAAYTFRSATGIPTTMYVAGLVSAADFNRDGRPDFVMRALVEGSIGLAVMVTGGSTHFWPTIDPNAGVITGDFNMDGHIDVIAHYESSANIREGTGLHTQWMAFLGDGAGGFAPSAVMESRLWLRQCQAADMNRDARLDLVCIGSDVVTSSPVLQVMTGLGDGTFRLGVAVRPAGLGASDVEIADVNRDGAPDVLVLQRDVEIWLGNGAGGLSNGGSINAAAIEYPTCLQMADLNHDGRLDLTIAGTNGVGIALGTASGFAPLVLLPARLGTFVITDLNTDGHPDLIGSGTMLFGVGDGTFGVPETFTFGGLPIVDFNHDGLLDFVYPAWQELRIVLNERNDVNHPPIVDAPDRVFDPQQVIWDCAGLRAEVVDPDRHAVTYEWRDAAGAIVSTESSLQWCENVYGTYEYTLTVTDGRGAVVTKMVSLSFVPGKEIVLHVMQEEAYWLYGNWMRVPDATAASGYRAYDSGVGGAKVTTPSANPAHAVRIQFVPDPTQTYKLWVRLKADNNSWANDSVWVQFSGSTDVSGTAKYRIGTTSALPVSLEECSNCGVSGWGWEDDGWGAPNRNGVLLRFPAGGVQHILVQTREDGVSIDQIVLSAEKYLTSRPGAPKNDTTILTKTFNASPY